jgi:hypothetical protein
VLQHIALILEVSAGALIYFDLKRHRADRGIHPLRMATGGLISGIKDRSNWFALSFALFGVAVLMEFYQLGCIYFAVSA